MCTGELMKLKLLKSRPGSPNLRNSDDPCNAEKHSKSVISFCWGIFPQGIFILCFLAMIGFNVFGIKKELNRIKMYKKIISHQKIGYKFNGLEQFTKGIEYIGYYTDKDFSQDESVKEFAQAQYLLAPTILEYNNLNHEYILFVCQNEINAWKKIQEIGASPLRRNKFGIILAKKDN